MKTAVVHSDEPVARISENFIPVSWSRAIYAGLIAGALFLFVSRGIPWNSGVMMPTVIGREIQTPTTMDGSMGTIAAGLHITFAALYGLIIGGIVHRFTPGPAIVAGGLLGLALYSLNYLVFNVIFPISAPDQRESVALLTHLAFGMVAAGAYKGMVRRRPESVTLS